MKVVSLLLFNFSTMSTMSSFAHGALTSSMGASPGSCLQQRESPTMGSAMGSYCMARPSYDIGIGYGSRPSPCSPSQPYQMNGHQYAVNGTSSTGSLLILLSYLRTLLIFNYNECLSTLFQDSYLLVYQFLQQYLQAKQIWFHRNPIGPESSDPGGIKQPVPIQYQINIWLFEFISFCMNLF